MEVRRDQELRSLEQEQQMVLKRTEVVKTMEALLLLHKAVLIRQQVEVVVL